MKTVLLSPELFLAEGGIARIMRSYLKALSELAGPSDQVASIVLNDRTPHDSRLPLYSTPALRQTTACARHKLRFVRATLAATRGGATVICGHLHLLPVAWLAAKLSRDTRYFLVAHGIEVWRPYTLLESIALRGAERILCISDYTRRQLLRFCPGLEPSRLVVVPNTLDPVLGAATPAREPHLPQPHGPCILTVGRLTAADAYKGCDTLIEALAVLRQSHPAVRLRIVGGGDDVPRLQALVQRLRLGAAVDFVGIVDDDALRREYRDCDIFALPSRGEGFGLVYLEAMQFGKPCLAAKAGGAPEVVNDHVGALADYAHIPELAAALADLLQHPRDPATIRARADRFSYSHFKLRLAPLIAR